MWYMPVFTRRMSALERVCAALDRHGVRYAYNPADLSEQVDVIITHDLKGMRRKRVQLANGTVQILALGDLIGMKRAAGRPQDLEDVEALEKLRFRVKAGICAVPYQTRIKRLMKQWLEAEPGRDDQDA